MTPAELRSILERCGYSDTDAARHLGKSRSMIQKMKAGHAPISEGVAHALDDMEDDYADELDRALRAAPETIEVWASNEDSWQATGRPARWHRTIAAAAHQHHGSRIVWRTAHVRRVTDNKEGDR